jgi:glycosyltransferase involved in cell wall biosynthesis
LRSIPNGVDRDRFSPIGDRADRTDEGPLIVCVGRLSEQKGQDVAIRALALLADRSARLRLVGDESGHGERARLGALATSLGVSDRVEWRGGVEATAPEYRAADVVVAPSRWDGLSLALLEAMACGAAIVASEVNGSESLGAAGLVVPPDDPESLAEAVAGLLGSGAERARLGRAAWERSRSFDLATTMGRNLDLWSGLAVRAASGPDPAAARAVADGGEGAARWTNTSTS